VTVAITVSATGKPPAGATVTAVCGERQIKVPVGVDGTAVAKDLEKGIWSFNVAAPGCYAVVGVVNVDPGASKSYSLPVKLDPEEPAAPAVPDKK